MNKQSKIYISDDNFKKVGEMHDSIYRKKVQSTVHLLRVMDAWGIDKKIVDELAVDGCKEIRIFDTMTAMVYAISYEDFVAKGVERNFSNKQIFLPRKYFKTYHYEPTKK